MAQPRSRVPVLLGISLAGAGGYYLYAAGGDPKAAEKKFEQDATSASSKIKSQLPGQKEEAKKEGEQLGHKAGAQLDKTMDAARAKKNEADSKISNAVGDAEAKASQLTSDGSNKFDQVRKDTGKQLSGAVDTFDKTVEKKAADAKSGISSWFGLGSGK